MAVAGYTFDNDPVIRVLLEKDILTYKGVQTYETEGSNPWEHTSFLNEKLEENKIFIPLSDMPRYDEHDPNASKLYPKKLTVAGHLFEIGDLEQATKVIKELYGEDTIELRHGRLP